MAFCRKCGNQMEDKSAVCTACGTKQESLEASKASIILWGIASFCIPLIGLILYISWHNTKPTVAKVAGITALISFILNVLLFVI